MITALALDVKYQERIVDCGIANSRISICA